MSRSINPLSGSKANECTEVRIPDLTKNIPIKQPMTLRIDNNIVQLLKIFLELLTMAEWNKAVANSQGTRED